MANSVRLYTIAFEKDGKPVKNISILDFFKKMDSYLKNNNNLIQNISNELIRYFEATYDFNNDYRIFIPFGKVKQKNKPYYLNEEQKLEELSRELFDINTLGYDDQEKILIFTTNRDGINIKHLAEYLNNLNKPTHLEIVITPILVDKGLVKVRSASIIRNIRLNLDLGKSLNNFYLNQIDSNNEQKNITDTLKSFVNCIKDSLDTNVLSIDLGVGRIGKYGTLDIDNIKFLLNELNLEEDFIKEIIVSYKDGKEDKIDTTKIKEFSQILQYFFNINASNISTEYMREYFDSCLNDKKRDYITFVRNYFRNAIDVSE